MAALFLMSCENALPALRGDHIFECRCSVGEFLRRERLDMTFNNVLPTLRGEHDFDFNVVFDCWLLALE